MNLRGSLAGIWLILLFVVALLGSCSMHPISAQFDQCLAGCMERCPEGEYDPGAYSTTADNRTSCQWNCQELCRDRNKGKTADPPKTPIFP